MYYLLLSLLLLGNLLVKLAGDFTFVARCLGSILIEERYYRCFVSIQFGFEPIPPSLLISSFFNNNNNNNYYRSLPSEDKLIQPLKGKGIAGGSKYQTHGMFLKWATDNHKLFESNYAAMKVLHDDDSYIYSSRYPKNEQNNISISSKSLSKQFHRPRAMIFEEWGLYLNVL